jgi:hypothetical protein
MGNEMSEAIRYLVKKEAERWIPPPTVARAKHDEELGDDARPIAMIRSLRKLAKEGAPLLFSKIAEELLAEARADLQSVVSSNLATIEKLEKRRPDNDSQRRDIASQIEQARNSVAKYGARLRNFNAVDWYPL